MQRLRPESRLSAVMEWCRSRRHIRTSAVLLGMFAVSTLITLAILTIDKRNGPKPKKPKSSRDDRHLVVLDQMDDLKRETMPHIHDPPPKSYEKEALRELAKIEDLKKANATFVLIVFGWRRRKSLQRLCNSLLAADYMGFSVMLEFHLEGESHPLVNEFVQNFNWPHGGIRIIRNTNRLGLRKIVTGSWRPLDDNQFGLFFEDDIEVAPDYFRYCLLGLRKYVFGGDGKRQRSYHHDHLIGFSLNTPRFHETTLAPVDWVPGPVVGPDPVFLFQLPCSWGALYFPWSWREFLEFYDWRDKNEFKANVSVTIPNSSVNSWTRSWKRFFIEMMYIKGYYMLYPNLPKQQSFSTHHREPGEHTGALQEENLVDDIGTIVLDFFTVPLVTDRKLIYSLFANMGPLKKLAVLDFSHRKAASVYELLQNGIFTAEALKPFGYEHELSHTGCILDAVSKPIKSSGKERYLFYVPQHNLSQQWMQLHTAVAMAHILGRTLIVPPYVNANSKGKVLPIDSVLRLDTLRASIEGGSGESAWTPMKLWSQVAPEALWIDRLVDMRDWKAHSDPRWRPSEAFLVQNSITPLRAVTIPVVMHDEADILRYYGKCQDRYLSFLNLFPIALRHTTKDAAYYKWCSSQILPHPKIEEFVQACIRQLSPVYGCVHYSRRDVESFCGLTQDSAGNITLKTIRYRNCEASVLRTLQYFLEYSTNSNITVGRIVLVYDAPSMSSVPSFIRHPQDSAKLFLATSYWIRSEASKARSLFPMDLRDNMEEMTRFSENIICERAALFVGNYYSMRSRHIYRRRKSLGLPSVFLGVGDYEKRGMFAP